MTHDPRDGEEGDREDAMTRFLLNEMAPEERSAFDRKMADDPELARAVESLRRTLGLLPYAVYTPPPPHLRARVLEAAVKDGALAPSPSGVGAPPKRALPWSPLLAVAASLVAVLVHLDNRSLRRQLELQTEASRLLQEPNVVVGFALAGREAGAHAFGRVVLDLDGGKGAVVIRRLPRLPEGQVYRLWALVGTQKVRCGEFNSDGLGSIVRQFPIPVHAYTEPVQELILTVESAAEAPSPRGPTVMIGS